MSHTYIEPTIYSGKTGFRAVARRDILSKWEGIDPILRLNEIAYMSDTDEFVIGDGVSKWSDLDRYVKGENK